MVRRGVTRTVFLVGRWAIKVPSLRGDSQGNRLGSFCWGVLANLNERTWSSYEGWAGQVAPVRVSLWGLVQIYPRCAPVSRGWREGLAVMDPDPGDHKADNYGVLDGRVVRVDYDIR